MDYIVHKIVNYPIDSNCFVIYKKYDFFCIVIDPGSENNEELISFFEKENIYPSYIILTHEHFDHILGANSLKEIYNSKIVCSEICSELISNSKKNLSLFYKNLDYKIKQVDILFRAKKFTKEDSIKSISFKSCCQIN